MTNYSVKPRDWIMDYGPSYGFVVMSYGAKDKSRKIGKNVSSKYRQKLLGQAENPATYALKTDSKRVIQKNSTRNR